MNLALGATQADVLGIEDLYLGGKAGFECPEEQGEAVGVEGAADLERLQLRIGEQELDGTVAGYLRQDFDERVIVKDELAGLPGADRRRVRRPDRGQRTGVVVGDRLPRLERLRRRGLAGRDIDLAFQNGDHDAPGLCIDVEARSEVADPFATGDDLEGSIGLMHDGEEGLAAHHIVTARWSVANRTSSAVSVFSRIVEPSARVTVCRSPLRVP